MAGIVRLWGRSVATIAFVVPLVAGAAACGARQKAPARPAAPEPPPITSAPPAVPDPAPPPSDPEPAPAPAPAPAPPALPPAPPPSAGDENDCAIIAEPGEPIETVAIRDRIDPANAPRPSNDGERLVFRQVYETLVRVDCHGRVTPGLAASWRLDADSRTWLLTLREHARFSDGTPVTTADVRAAWTHGGNGGGDLLPAVGRLLESAAAVDDRVLAVVLHRPRADAPLALAHPDLAIAKAVSGSPWPLGTRADGSVAASSSPGATGHGEITIAREAGPALRFLPAARDPRDLLDAGVDLLLTRDPATLDYAATLPHVRSVPLDWRRTHVLLTPGRGRTAPSLPAQARQALADDAVRGEARGAAEPFWWQALDACDLTPARAGSLAASAPRVVYDATDDAARDLAERVVGLGRVSSPAAAAMLDALLPDRARRTGLRAAGLTGEALAVARRRGADAAYVIALDRAPFDPCGEMASALDGAPWLESGAIVPLVDTRLRAIVRRGRSGVTVEGDGTVRIAGSGPRGGQ
jgi:hypothetical protein